MGWQARLSSQIHLVGCKESKKYSRTLERASCRYSREWHGSKTARARTKVPGALPGCEGSQNRKLNGIARSYKRRSGAQRLLAHLKIESPWAHFHQALL